MSSVISSCIAAGDATHLDKIQEVYHERQSNGKQR